MTSQPDLFIGDKTDTSSEAANRTLTQTDLETYISQKEEVKAQVPTFQEEKIDSVQVANEILKQLGGAGCLRMMTGAKQFVAGSDGCSVSFKFPNRVRSLPNHVTITLNSLDLYDVTFSRMVKYDLKKKETTNGVYNDRLKDLFEEKTGLTLRIPTIFGL